MGRAVVLLAGEASPIVDPEPQEAAGQPSRRVLRPLALSDLPRESGQGSRRLNAEAAPALTLFCQTPYLAAEHSHMSVTVFHHEKTEIPELRPQSRCSHL